MYKQIIVIRLEQAKDIDAIREINRHAFGQREEASLVDNLRQSGCDLLSLVAIAKDRVIGHILFSPVSIETKRKTVHGMGLGPMAVEPGQQRKGVGSELVRKGIEILKERRCPFVVVLGHPQYYRRFGFESASRWGIRCEWDAPDEAFMLLVLDASEMHGIKGLARYRSEFNAMEQS